MITLAAGDLRTKVRFERLIPDDSFTGNGKGTWVKVAEVMGEVRDVLPSRGESTSNDATIGNRPSRIRIRYRRDIDSSMRVVIGSRVLQIVAGPAELGIRAGLEMLAQEYSTQGGAA